MYRTKQKFQQGRILKSYRESQMLNCDFQLFIKSITLRKLNFVFLFVTVLKTNYFPIHKNFGKKKKKEMILLFEEHSIKVLFREEDCLKTWSPKSLHDLDLYHRIKTMKKCIKKIFADMVLFTVNQCVFDEGVFGLCLTIS